ncbi:MAG: hypothetical protein M1498_03150 [Candidatus Thermoplasmatota archaeon]|nr:hypothetical protein [Candidatus Thermoplasmatota archaeon]MCL5888882.1 hypothetical protein [Candidatus Thermoplasmatota archaeon]
MAGIHEQEDEEIGIVSSFFTILKVDRESNILTFSIPEGEYSSESFEKLYNALKAKGFFSYTNGKGEIISFPKVNNKRRTYLKFVLMILTVLSIIYAGYTYSSSYYSGLNPYTIFMLALLYFALPVVIILVMREVPKYLIMRARKQKYSFPLFVPNPFLMGTMGIINAPDEPYMNSDDEIMAGFSSLLIGFIVSTTFLLLGYLGVSLYTGASYLTNSSTSVINIPLLIQLITGHFIPSSGFLDPVSLAGWSGLIFTSFNAFPIGLMDGGMILSGFNRSFRKNVSYIFITIMIFISFTYLAWLILPLFLAFLGMGSIEPVDMNYLKASKKALAAIGITMALAIIGLSPYPIHLSSPEMGVFYNGQWDVSVNGSHSMSTYGIIISNYGQSNINPGFSLNPAMGITISTNNTLVKPGETNTFNIGINTTTAPVGMNRVNLRVCVGGSNMYVGLSFFKLYQTSAIQMNNFPAQVSNESEFLENVTLYNTNNQSVTENLLIGAPENWHYYVMVSNTTRFLNSIPLEQNGSYSFGTYQIQKPSQKGLNFLNIRIYSEEMPESNIYFAVYNSTDYGNMLTILE